MGAKSKRLRCDLCVALASVSSFGVGYIVEGCAIENLSYVCGVNIVGVDLRDIFGRGHGGGRHMGRPSVSMMVS